MAEQSNCANFLRLHFFFAGVASCAVCDTLWVHHVCNAASATVECAPVQCLCFTLNQFSFYFTRSLHFPRDRDGERDVAGSRMQQKAETMHDDKEVDRYNKLWIVINIAICLLFALSWAWQKKFMRIFNKSARTKGRMSGEKNEVLDSWTGAEKSSQMSDCLRSNFLFYFWKIFCFDVRLRLLY